MKCIASDLDGTILMENNTMSKRTQYVIKKLLEQDILFLVCTGRSYKDFRSAFPSDIKIPAILLNGSLFVDNNGKEIFSYPMQIDQVKEVEQYLLNHNLPCLYFTANGIFGSGRLGLMKKCVKVFYPSDYDGDYFMEPVKKVNGYKELKHPILKMECMCVETNVIKEMKEYLNKIGNIQISSSLPYNIEITAGHINKSFMLHKVLISYQLSKDELLYFGDSNNDLEVFKKFKNCIAVANANEEIKTLALDICKCCEEDGVANYISEKVSQIA